MKPVYLKVINSPESSFDIRHEIAPYFRNPLHFHPELELTLILESSGTQFIGSNISRFNGNELTLTGANLPHFWRNDPVYYQDNHSLRAEAIIIRFTEHFLSKSFFQLPEMQHVNTLFNKSKRGLKINGDTKNKISEKMCMMMQMNGAERIIALLEILNLIASSSECKFLCDMGFVQKYDYSDTIRINDVYTYVLENFMSPVHLDVIASVANMNPSAFCRYFRSKTGKTFSKFIQEIRIGYACKLLIDGKFNVSQVCYECGFNNESHFIKQFKRIKNTTPLKFQKLHSLENI